MRVCLCRVFMCVFFGLGLGWSLYCNNVGGSSLDRLLYSAQRGRHSSPSIAKHAAVPVAATSTTPTHASTAATPPAPPAPPWPSLQPSACIYASATSRKGLTSQSGQNWPPHRFMAAGVASTCRHRCTCPGWTSFGGPSTQRAPRRVCGQCDGCRILPSSRLRLQYIPVASCHHLRMRQPGRSAPTLACNAWAVRKSVPLRLVLGVDSVRRLTPRFAACLLFACLLRWFVLPP